MLKIVQISISAIFLLCEAGENGSDTLPGSGEIEEIHTGYFGTGQRGGGARIKSVMSGVKGWGGRGKSGEWGQMCG